jgi:restriction system protein
VAIPEFQALMLPTLALAGDGQVHSLAEAREVLAAHFGLSRADREELLPSGRQRRFDNRVAWAKVYLEQAGLLSSPKRAHFVITDSGRGLLAQHPAKIDIGLLEQFAQFREFQARSSSKDGDVGPAGTTVNSKLAATPEEALDQAYQSIRAELTSDLLTKLKTVPPAFFETLVVELLLKMGYGRSRADAGRAIGSVGDEGIDGIISEDRLGLDTIYLQAKRWAGSVGRPEIQKFVGALHGKRARKGVFITTGTFSPDAREYVAHIDPRVVLIDGTQLAEYMIDLGLGVSTRAVYELKRIDSDYFVEE